ncbi:FG-GAP-like repeat-containing protein [Sandaracinus amylolyticus]|nr:FG-GAP-like repeat-containing protein [Sandaracinus amylolyticus]
MKRAIRRIAVGLVLALGLPQTTAAQVRRDAMVQAPEVRRPGRGSVAGAYAAVGFDPETLSRGTIDVAGPFEAPDERGAPLVPIFPTYAPDRGLSEWGVGWSASFAIRRHRDRGDLDFATDDFASPWGVLVQGDDGAYYPRGMAARVRVTREPDRWSAVLEDGTRITFRDADAIRTSRGIYQWSVSEAVTPLGDRTTWEYAARSDQAKRPYVQRVTYGGRESTPQVEVRFDYDGTIGARHVDYASGVGVALDRRVREVRVSTWDPASASYLLRHRYELGYEESPAGVAFYLSRAQRFFASGEPDSPRTFTYRFGEQDAAEATLAEASVLDSYLEAWGVTALMPDVSSYVDVDRDGRTDLENRYDHELARHTDAGLEYETLPRDGTEDPECRPVPSLDNQPRLLARIDGEQRVLRTTAVGDVTRVTMCDRQGHRLSRVSVSGAGWTLGARTRLVDVDRDRRPDLVRVTSSGYEVMRNTGDASALSFAAVTRGTLTIPSPVDTLWVQDVNGDGIADLVGRTASALQVWPGLGGRRFAASGTRLQVRRASGEVISDLRPYQIAFLDANRDGLIDVLLSSGSTLRLYTHRGDRFSEQSVPALATVAFDVGYPVAVDLEGRGEEQALVSRRVDGANHAYAVTLTSPRAGLMVRADDGRGGAIELDYVRAPAIPGMTVRPPLLARVTTHDAGADSVTSHYDYDDPVFHSVSEGLVGYRLVRRASATSLGEIEFHHDDDVSGLVVATRTLDTLTADLPAGLHRFTEHVYEDALVRAVRTMREVRVRGGLRDAEGHEALGAVRDVIAWSEDGLCPEHVRTTGEHGTLEIVHTRAEVAALAGALHCEIATETEIGTHPARAALDFRYDARLVRNGVGQIERVEMLSGGEAHVLQQSTYDALHRLVSLTTPGRGTTTVAYAPGTGEMLEVVGADGVRGRVEERDARSGAMTRIAFDRGPGGELREHWRYDGMERLASRWDSVGAGSEAMPEEAISYAWASSTHPGSIVTRTLVDASAGTYAESAELFTAAGRAIAGLSRLESGWAVGDVTIETREQARTDVYRRAPIAVTGAGEIAFATLFDEASRDWVATTTSSVLGHTPGEEQLVRDGVTRRLATAVGLANGHLVHATYENGALFSTRELDAEGRVIAVTDGGGARAEIAYDALGRVVGVLLPDGTTRQTARFDAQGRPSEVAHDGVGSVRLVYQGAGDLVAERSWHAPDGTRVRSARYAYDAAGREIERTNVRASDGAEETFRFLYDGERPDGGVIPGQRGRRTSVIGPTFARWDRFLPDGSIAKSELVIDGGWRTIRLDYTHFEDGAIRSVDRLITDAAGAVLSSMRRTTQRDALGRIERVVLSSPDGTNARTLYALSYDDQGRLSHATIGSGDLFVPEYDPPTRTRVGYTHDTSDVTLTSREERDARGLVTTQHVELESASSSTSYDRALSYDARRFLRGSTGGGTTTAYAFDATGAMASAQDVSGARAFVRSGDVLQAGGVTYRLDGMGRVIARDDLAITYGPNGDVERAERGDRVWTYAYDETGQRLLKRENGVITMATLPGGVFLVGSDVVEPVIAGGHTVGLLVNGALRPLATDTRGTVIADGDGHAIDVSPFGVRSSHDALAAVIEYASSGYDADLQTVRMGVRDYDPYLGRFRTPDPLYMEEIDRCASSPTQCQLFAYVSNDPLSYVDPSGLEERPAGAQPINTTSYIESYEESTRAMVDGVVDGYNGNRPLIEASRHYFLFESWDWDTSTYMRPLYSTDRTYLTMLTRFALAPVGNPALREAELSFDRTARLLYTVDSAGPWQDNSTAHTANASTQTQDSVGTTRSNTTTHANEGSVGAAVGAPGGPSASFGAKSSVSSSDTSTHQTSRMVQTGSGNTTASTFPTQMRVSEVRLWMEIVDNHGNRNYYQLGRATLIDSRVRR